MHAKSMPHMTAAGGLQGVCDERMRAQVWENLTAIANKFPVEGNKGGSYLTMFSKGGFIFGIINIIGNFGTVFVDQVGSQSCVLLPLGLPDAWPGPAHPALQASLRAPLPIRCTNG